MVCGAKVGATNGVEVGAEVGIGRAEQAERRSARAIPPDICAARLREYLFMGVMRLRPATFHQWPARSSAVSRRSLRVAWSQVCCRPACRQSQLQSVRRLMGSASTIQYAPEILPAFRPSS